MRCDRDIDECLEGFYGEDSESPGYEVLYTWKGIMINKVLEMLMNKNFHGANILTQLVKNGTHFSFTVDFHNGTFKEEWIQDLTFVTGLNTYDPKKDRIYLSGFIPIRNYLDGSANRIITLLEQSSNFFDYVTEAIDLKQDAEIVCDFQEGRANVIKRRIRPL